MEPGRTSGYPYYRFEIKNHYFTLLSYRKYQAKFFLVLVKTKNDYTILHSYSVLRLKLQNHVKESYLAMFKNYKLPFTKQSNQLNCDTI